MQKNQARPYDESKLPSLDEWRAIPVTPIKISLLIPTQYYAVIDRLMEIRKGSTPEGGDLPHIVSVNGSHYIHDGHHRLTLAALQGITTYYVRIVYATVSHKP